MTNERRQTNRSRVFQGAKLVFNGHQSIMDCSIRNRSEAGAMLRMSDWIALPKVFEVMMSGQPDSMKARLCWRKGDDLGVAFLLEDEARPAAPIELDLERKLRACKAENAALKQRVTQLES